MAFYRSRIHAIEAERFDAELDIPGVRVKQSQSGIWHVWNARQQTYLPILPGAFLVFSDLNDAYPVEAQKFHARYERLAGPEELAEDPMPAVLKALGEHPVQVSAAEVGSEVIRKRARAMKRLAKK